jgi:hypothetical protein
MPVVPFRVFGFAACARVSPPQAHPLGIGCSLRVLTSCGSAVIGSAIPLCHWPFPRLCGFPAQGFAGYCSVSSRLLYRVSPPFRVSPSQT